MMGKSEGAGCTFITASLVLTFALIAVGICFFSPYWLQNIGVHPENDTDINSGYIVVNGSSGPNVTRYYPDRGLWAQCGAECVWFWSSGYALQVKLFTPLAWHLATQILYFIAGALLLVTEIYARVQMCCTQKSKIILSLGICVLISALLQIASFAVFGGGAYKRYGVVSDPREIVTKYNDMGDRYWNTTSFAPSEFVPVIGWSFWIGVVGAFMSIVSGVFFLVSYCDLALTCCPCCD